MDMEVEEPQVAVKREVEIVTEVEVVSEDGPLAPHASEIVTEVEVVAEDRPAPVAGAAAGASHRPRPMTSQEALRQAEAEGLTLLRSDNVTCYKNVRLNKQKRSAPFEATLYRNHGRIRLGSFATAEEAALILARAGIEQGYNLILARAGIQPPVPADRELSAWEKPCPVIDAPLDRTPAPPPGAQATVQCGSERISTGFFDETIHARHSDARSITAEEVARRHFRFDPMAFSEFRPTQDGGHLPLPVIDAPLDCMPAPPPIPQPMAAAAAAAEAAAGGNVVTIEIVVPPNALPGHPLMCRLPNGMTHSAIVPAGVAPGSKVHFKVQMTSGVHVIGEVDDVD